MHARLHTHTHTHKHTHTNTHTQTNTHTFTYDLHAELGGALEGEEVAKSGPGVSTRSSRAPSSRTAFKGSAARVYSHKQRKCQC